jgi:hypothetical protein
MPDLTLYLAGAAILVIWGLSLWMLWGQCQADIEFLRSQLAEAMAREEKHTDRIRALGQDVFGKDTEIKRLWHRITDLENVIAALRKGKEIG